MTPQVSDKEVQERIEYFNKYANTLFDMPIAPEPKSMPFVEIDLANKQQCGILFDLMFFGYNKKSKQLRESNDQYQIDLSNDPQRLIEHVIEFFKATGYSAKFNGFEKNEQGVVTNVNISFGRLP
jgi:hypothetical protein